MILFNMTAGETDIVIELCNSETGSILPRQYKHYRLTCALLLLPGEMNILQIKCKIDFNTFLLPKPQSQCKK